MIINTYLVLHISFENVEFVDNLEILSEEYSENRLCILSDCKLSDSKWFNEDSAALISPLAPSTPN